MNIKRHFLHLVKNKNGFKVLHAHFDKSNVITPQRLFQAQNETMQQKWDTYNDIKASYTFEDVYKRAEDSLHILLKQNATLVRTFTDADSFIGQMCIDALCQLKEDYKTVIDIQIATQPIQGIHKSADYKAFKVACSKADLVGGLPSRDPDPKEHLECLFELATQYDLPVDVHVDQLNSPLEFETQLLLDTKKKVGFTNKVNAVQIYGIDTGHEVFVTYKKKFVEPTAEDNTLVEIGLENEYEPIIMAGVAAQMMAGRDIPTATADYISDQLATTNFPVDSGTRIRNSLLAYQRALIQQARKDLRARFPEPVTYNSINYSTT